MKATQITLILLLALVAIATVTADDGAICGVSQGELMKCKPAVAAGTATTPPPTPECCAAVKHADLTCFCTFKNNPYLPFLGIDGAKAMKLPSKCDPTRPANC